MKNNTAHSLDEFNNFPWNKLTDALNLTDNDPEDPSTEFQVSGIHHGGLIADVAFNGRPHIDFTRSDGSVDAWEIPKELEDLVDEYYERGKRDQIQEIKSQVNALISYIT